jgi:hypothetical protein
MAHPELTLKQAITEQAQANARAALKAARRKGYVAGACYLLVSLRKAEGSAWWTYLRAYRDVQHRNAARRYARVHPNLSLVPVKRSDARGMIANGMDVSDCRSDVFPAVTL